ncbi:alpha/beta hydrolase [Nitrospirillum sp. BR 11828]|uniref:alpha/beta fold hydrolase n=1 Tax=Nitrospirillum sp. BR 11828 TaxID=3104325 RepID=UPI002ACADBF1|nr:alpha/beta hydrolase [Nitrospirillum sp. BR 11828]MDZ5649742.1 alpha/beta hydrolase [Nitrospirillum sp. BR 11828]
MAGLSAALIGASFIPARAGAKMPPAPAVPVPPAGPWARTGDIQRAGGVLHYATLGSATDKPPVILLHKLGGWLSDWRFVAPALAEGRQIIAFDLPGHGGSRWSGEPPYLQTLEETAATLVGALDEMGIDQIDLIGTSLGGCLSVPLAVRWPERVRKLALVSCALGGHRTLAEIREDVDAKQANLYDRNGYPVPTKPELLTQIFGIVNTGPINADGIDSRKAAGRWIQPSERGVAFADIMGALPRIQAPTLLVYGEFDKAYVKFRSDAEKALKNSRTEVVPNSGAFVMQDNPAATAEILKRFVNEA